VADVLSNGKISVYGDEIVLYQIIQSPMDYILMQQNTLPPTGLQLFIARSMQSHLSWLVVSPLWQKSNSSGSLVFEGL